MRPPPAILLCIALLFVSNAPALDAGTARIDITPQFPVRLSGYGNRTTNHQAVAQKIWARALALGSGSDAALLITIDNCAISATFADDIAARIKARFGVPRDRIAFCVTHTHSAPMLSGVIPNLFASDIRSDQQDAIDRYTRALADKLDEVAAAALNDRRRAKVSWSEGAASFAMNRRAARAGSVQLGINASGPVDHSLPMLVVSDEQGEKVRAVWAGYACHCTTMGGDFNQVHGDWAGCAGEQIEQRHPGAIALISIGCGGDANPNPRGKTEHAEAHGRELAQEMQRLLALPRTELASSPQCRFDRFDIDFQALPSRAEWEQRAQQKGIVGYHARKNLARLDRGETLPTTLPYTVQTWSFGTNLAIVFLAGEVVIDYQLRLKREFDRARLWVNGYANDVPCYIPSARVLREGGYEAQDSLWYYDRPTRLSTNIEERIIRAVHGLMPTNFLNTRTNASEMPAPLSPAAALKSFRVPPGFTVDCVAHEPLVLDPVAIDWGVDGKLWVAEMRDYPSGTDGHWKPGGVVKFLQDTNSDGRYDTAQVFLENVPFPTGVYAWRKGVLVCAAPDITYAEDTDGDGRADIVRKVFSGFETNNYQARVNGLSLGLDNWVYGANGLLGGVISGRSGTNAVDIRGRDFRMNPDTGAFEPASGLSQQGRVRDDFGNWFGCDNSHLSWHFPLPDHYARRNPFVSAPTPAVHTPRSPDWNRLYPSSRTLERFNDAQSANRVTSACGLEIYRDELLGNDYSGNAFTCESVHNLVHREVLRPDGITFTSTRAPGDESTEFFSSSDNWCRPVQARTGPDGTLWIVDMYRYVIEHPRWIASNRLATLKVRAGDDKGRIYRVFAAERPPRRFRPVAQLGTADLATALDSPNGTMRDMVHRELLNRADTRALPFLERIAAGSSRPAARVQALGALAGLQGLRREHVLAAMRDNDPRVRAFGVQLSENSLNDPGLGARVAELWRDISATVRYQVALSAGQARREDSLRMLAPLLPEAASNRWLRAALLSSSTNCAAELLPGAIDTPALSAPLLATVLGTATPPAIEAAVSAIIPGKDDSISTARLSTIATLAERSDRSTWFKVSRTAHLLEHARAVLANSKAELEARSAALRLLGAAGVSDDLDRIARLLAPNVLQSNALAVLTRNRSPRVPGIVVTAWPHLSPAQREASLEALISRTEWRQPVMQAVEQGSIASGEFPIALRNRLRESAESRTLAEKLWPQRSAGKSEVWSAYEKALTGAADRPNGLAVFERTCASCHSLRGVGHSVGPDLAPLHDKGAQDFLLGILDPNAAVEPRFVNYNVEMRDGRSLSGVIRSETASGFTLVQGGGIEHNILRTEVSEIRASTLSLMPEGLEQGITPQEMRDLIAFVKTPPPRLFGTATPAQVQASAEALRGAEVRLSFATEHLDYPGYVGRLPFWHCRQSDGQGRVEWEGTGRMVIADQVEFTVPAAMGFASQPRGTFTLHVNGRPALDFDVSLIDAAWSSPDGQVKMVYQVEEANSEDSSGMLKILLAKRFVGESRRAHFRVTGARAASQRWFGIYELPKVSARN